MATNLGIDEKLLEEARRLGGQKTKKDTVNEALDEYISRRKQKKIVGLFGQVVYEEGYDYKAERRRR
ncbi:MAG: type II toxin-antitoxin system VapB family antitoxin [Actinomycetota bacterium]|nr:type II toxin-antitoxin system VapB family antitoxin [Actinomycetota bacterium]